MSSTRLQGLLTGDEVAGVRAVRSQGSSRDLVALVERIAAAHASTPLDWPARAYIYGTWGYALRRAIERAREFNQHMFLYSGTLDGEHVWVVSWDPKPTVNE